MQACTDNRYNPVLGEFFRCTYNYPDGSEGLYIAEQVSHHPVRLCQLADTDDSPSQLSSTSRPPMAIMEGEDRIRLLDRPEDGEYVITVGRFHILLSIH
jgi:hypothetical protein